MAQLNNEKKFLTLKDFPNEKPSKQNAILNFIDSDAFQNPIQTLWSSPWGKVVVVSAATLLLLYAAGYLFRLLAFVKEGYVLFMTVGNRSTGAPPKP